MLEMSFKMLRHAKQQSVWELGSSGHLSCLRMQCRNISVLTLLSSCRQEECCHRGQVSERDQAKGGCEEGQGVCKQ